MLVWIICRDFLKITDVMQGVVAVSTYMGGTRGAGVLSSACDVLEMSVV